MKIGSYRGRVDCRAGDLPVPNGADFYLVEYIRKIKMPEVEIYHSYSAYQDPDKLKKKKSKLDLAEILAQLSKYLLLTGVIVLIISFAPSVWYQIKSGGIEKISNLITETIKGKQEKAVEVKNIEYQPRYDPKLPMEQRIKIPSVRIDTQIWEATIENHEEALKKGVWRAPDFGTPIDRKRPTILAAHRYGYLAWSIPFRLKNSFYSLPKLKVGDTVEIIWRQRKYIYEIYSESKGEEIDDYSANLILYTCESLNSPERIFKYGRLLEI